jgi:hypothetical protein
MIKSHPKREDAASLKPVGFALAAVVAGIGVGKAPPVEARVHAPLEPSGHANTYVIDPTNHPGFEEDPDMVVDRSEPVAPFGKR